MALSDDLYEKLTDEEDARLCRDIDERACRESPQNFFYLLTSQFLTKLGDAIASPKTTLAWLTTTVGAPAFVLGLLVPIRESGSLIPQLFIGGIVRSLPVRKWVWVVGSVAQAACIAGIGFVALRLDGAAAGWSILGLVTLFSLARGFCSVASKDVLGKTIPKKIRGQLTGGSARAAGLLTVGVGVALMLPIDRASDTACRATRPGGEVVVADLDVARLLEGSVHRYPIRMMWDAAPELRDRLRSSTPSPGLLGIAVVRAGLRDASSWSADDELGSYDDRASFLRVLERRRWRGDGWVSPDQMSFLLERVAEASATIDLTGPIVDREPWVAVVGKVE